MILPFELGRSAGGRGVTKSTEIDDARGVSQQDINDVQRGGIVNVTQLYGLEPCDFTDVIDTIINEDEHAEEKGLLTPGIVLTYLSYDGWKSKQWNGDDVENFEDPNTWKDYDQSALIEEIAQNDRAHHASRFARVVEGHITFEQQSLRSINFIVAWCKEENCFAAVTVASTIKYYRSWVGQEEFVNPETQMPYIDKQYVCGNKIYMYDSTANKLVETGGSSASSIFNVTNSVPISGYYVLVDQQNTEMSAVHAAWRADKAASGLIMSFEISAGIWKTYQYIGKTVNETNWLNRDNWKDFGSLAAGSETYIIIDEMIGAPVAGDYYTLESAVARLVAYQQQTSVNYAKKGLIISYRTGENTMETKQFQGQVTDFGEVGLWKDFGGGTDVEVTDEPEENS